ncbi:MAG TPA: AAA family ATPase [Gammaproteobacteria bacterium]|nr:AAA family ATPase [Gammaproteobacteria bacterium]
MSLAIHPSAAESIPENTCESRLAALAPRPQSLEATGLSERFLADLIAKHLHSAGTLTLAELTERVALTGPILEKVLHFMRREARVEIKPRVEGQGTLPYALTDHGRSTALDAFMRSGYVGPAPVPLEKYNEMVRKQSVHGRQIDPLAVRKALEGMEISEDAADQFGISINSGRPIFIYGPAGTGKTYTTQKLSQLFREVVLIPFAVAVDELVVEVFDPVLHQSVKLDSDDKLMLEKGHDPRYSPCERPVIVTGGELTLDLLDVRFEATTRQYEAPLQLKANNGMFVIDDLGRQKVAPDALFNRWIVPMNDKQDFHALGSGRHFVTPFDVVLVFSSNMHPLDLADEAFLRRIGHKIYCGYASPQTYESIWKSVCRKERIPYDPEHVHYLLSEHYRRDGRPLLPCHPKDLIGIAMDKARYTGANNELTEELLDWAWDTYFVSMDREAGMSRVGANQQGER